MEKRDEGSEAAIQLKREILADLCREHALVPRRELDKLVMQRSMGLMHPYDAMGVVAEMFGDEVDLTRDRAPERDGAAI